MNTEPVDFVGLNQESRSSTSYNLCARPVEESGPLRGKSHVVSASLECRSGQNLGGLDDDDQ